MALLTASEWASLLRSRSVSAGEVLDHFLREIRARDPELRAFLAVDEARAREDAEKAQRMLDSGEGGPLTGVPVAIKDNISTEGIRTTCASRVLQNYVPVFDAHVVERLRASGMVGLGKTNMDEFAMGASNETSAFGPCRSPWGTDLVPGGSSGGSACAVSAGMAPLALGSDTGGSIRQPAALCGVVGFKPTYGRVSRYGLVAFGSSLDQIGPIALTVDDCWRLAEAISGHDPKDSTSLPDSKIVYQPEELSLKGLRFALPAETMGESVQPGVRAQVMAAIHALQAAGAHIENVSVPSVELGVSTYYIIAPAEASSNLARFDGIRFGELVPGDGHLGNVARTRGTLFGHEVKQRIMIGTYALSAGYFDDYYVRAQRVRALMTADFEQLYAQYDAVISPTSPCVAFRIGELSHDPLALKLMDFCTIPANMGGFPSLSIPCGLSEGLPVGLLLTGPVLGDERLLQTGRAVQKVLGVGPLTPGG